MAFNVRPVKNPLKENCQVINKTVGRMNRDSAYESDEDNGWILYNRLHYLNTVSEVFVFS